MKKMTMKGTKSSECGLTKSYVRNIKIHEDTFFSRTEYSQLTKIYSKNVLLKFPLSYESFWMLPECFSWLYKF